MSLTATTAQERLTEVFRIAFSRLPSDPDRKAAFDRFLETGFPTTGHEEYRFTPITRSLEKNLVSISTGSTVGTVSVPSIPGTATIVMVNGQPQPYDLPDGLERRHDASMEPFTGDPFALLNAAFRQGVIHIEAKRMVNTPVHIHWHTNAAEGTVFTAPHVELTVRKNCSLTVIETYGHDSGHAFSTQTMKAHVEEGGRLDHLRLQQVDGTWDQVYNGVIRQDQNSVVNAFILTTAGQIVRNNLTLEIDGTGAEGNLLGLYLLNGKTLADNHTVVDHRQPGANSNELYKGVMQGQSKGVFNGKIFVRPDAQKTNAFQSNRNIILSDNASVNTKPQLEIWADDVKCSHGCTSGQLDEEGIFYLMSRGIDKASAQAMMLDAYAGEVTDKIPSSVLAEFIRKVTAETIAQLK